MYLAKFEDDTCGAKYFYGKGTIYFNIDYSLSQADEFALHECLHYLQEVKDSNNNLLRLGLYDLTTNRGMALNEAAVQKMAVEALKVPVQNVSYYGLDLPSNSPDCYPLECSIISQMAYFTGTYPLYYSTLNGNDIFKNTFIALSNEHAFERIENNLDKMVHLESEVALYSNELKTTTDGNKKVKKINSIISNDKNQIAKLYLDCQNTIISSCFSNELNNIHTLEELKAFKNKLYQFKDYIASNDSYDFYNEYYRNTMEKIDEKAAFIEEHGPFEFDTNLTTDLTVVSKVRGIFALFARLRRIFGLSKEKNY